MAFKVIVFDFDGTLIDSNQLKYDAFFELFPQNELHKRVITDVLNKFLEKSRYVILKEILKRIEKGSGEAIDIETRIDELASKYNIIVISKTKTCKEKTGATKLLKNLSSKYRLYLSSVTPQGSLRDILKYKRLDKFFCDIFGYPNKKASVLLKIMRRESIQPKQLLVVGDGASDKDSANEVGCQFFEVSKDTRFEDIVKFVRNSTKSRR